MTTSLLVFFGGGQEKAEYRFRYPADEGTYSVVVVSILRTHRTRAIEVRGRLPD